MAKNNHKKVYYEHSEESIVADESTGEVVSHSQKRVTSAKLPDEPPFVKLYLDCLCKFKDMQISFNPILIEFLKKASYADADSDNGGQVIYMNKMLKENIAKKCNVSLKRVEQAITEFVKKGIMRRIGVGTYQFNPNLFGFGRWSDIYNIRAVFDFGTGQAVAQIVKNEEEKMNTVTDEVANQSAEEIERIKKNEFNPLSQMTAEELDRIERELIADIMAGAL